MNAQKLVLIDETMPPKKTVLINEENERLKALNRSGSTNANKTGGNIPEKNNSNTALIIAVIALVIMIGIFIYKNMQDNE